MLRIVSDDSNSEPYLGVWIDDIAAWTYVDTGPAEELADLAINPDLDVDYCRFQANAGETIAATIRVGDRSQRQTA